MSWFKRNAPTVEAASSGVKMWHSGAAANVEVIGPLFLVRHKGREHMTTGAYLSPEREENLND